MNPTDTPRTDAAHNSDKYEEYSYDVVLACSRQLERELAEKTNEVARLRELLNRAIQIADGLIDPFRWITGVPEQELAKLKTEAALSPAPEEPETSAHLNKCIGNVKSANPTCLNTTHKFSHCDYKEHVSNGTRIAAETRSACNDMAEEERTKYAALAEDLLKLHRPDIEPAPTWRELGPDEVIQEGDEVQPKHHDKINGEWQKAWSFELGVNAGHFKAMLYRTSRPLPKQEEKAPDDLHAWMRLQETINLDIASDLQALRDEIQKLKESK
jgi:hypothetical protein